MGDLGPVDERRGAILRPRLAGGGPQMSRNQDPARSAAELELARAEAITWAAIVILAAIGAFVVSL